MRSARVEPHGAWSGLLGLDVSRLLQRAGLATGYGDLYAEWAKLSGAADPGHGRYASASVGVGTVGLSFEFKDYDRFNLLGNDPPPLVREHTAYLLNRRTHVMEPRNERGVQVEVVFPVEGVGTFTANYSRARNTVGAVTRRFDERYLALEVDRFGPDRPLQAFFDWGRDELGFRKALRTGGVTAGTTLGGGWSADVDAELQRGVLPFGAAPNYWDAYGAIAVEAPGGIRLSAAVDRTTDPLETDDPATLTVQETSPVRFWSATASGGAGNVDAVLFVGERRGGIACTSGTCYQVLPFRGAELRLMTRF
jgi:hypothetical protein